MYNLRVTALVGLFDDSYDNMRSNGGILLVLKKQGEEASFGEAMFGIGLASRKSLALVNL